MEEMDEEYKQEGKRLFKEYIGKCVEYKMSKSGILEMMDFIINLMKEKHEQKQGKKMNPEFFIKLKEDINKELDEYDENKFGDGQNDNFILPLVKNFFKNKKL